MPRAKSFPLGRRFADGAVGLEIGGPSPIFASGGLIPLYPRARRVDNCNFGSETIWEGEIRAGSSFAFHPGKSPGTQYIAEGTNLHMIAGDAYDFVLSSHMLEHTANPLRALAEWKRVIKPGGGIVLIVPHRDGTFDHRRPVTPMSHLLEDLSKGTAEDDQTHLPEILQLHDAARDPEPHELPFPERAAQNARLRSMHHHVFDTRLAAQAMEHAAFEILSVELLKPYHIVVIARKPEGPAPAAPGAKFPMDGVLQRSPFPTDRQ